MRGRGETQTLGATSLQRAEREPCGSRCAGMCSTRAFYRAPFSSCFVVPSLVVARWTALALVHRLRVRAMRSGFSTCRNRRGARSRRLEPLACGRAATAPDLP